MTDFKDFIGAARRIEDLDLPRIAHRIGVGEDELHALMDTETSGKGFDSKGRPKMLFEPHRFYANLKGDERLAAVKAGLAYKDWKPGAYPRDSYPRLKKAMLINETAALKASSWALGQVMGENHLMAGFSTVQAMVLAMMEDEENHVDAMVNFIIKAGIDDELRALAKLTRPTTPADCIPIVEVYNGKGFRKNDYHVKFARNHNKWRGIKDTAWVPTTPVVVDPAPHMPVLVPKVDSPAAPKPAVAEKALIESVQKLLRDKGYPEVGTVDGLFGNRTRNTILAFEADNGLPLSGMVSDALLASLVKAPVRAMSAERETATAKDLKEQGNKTVGLGDWIQKIGVAIIGAMGLGGVSDGIINFDQIKKGIGDVRSIGDAVGPMLPWLLAAGAGVVVVYYGRKIVTEQVQAFREGRSV